jgi:hypothetical protein
MKNNYELFISKHEIRGGSWRKILEIKIFKMFNKKIMQKALVFNPHHYIIKINEIRKI